MMHDSMNDDALSLGMFWAGALMAFAPMIGASIVLAVWWRKRKALGGGAGGTSTGTASFDEGGAGQRDNVSTQASGVAIRPT